MAPQSTFFQGFTPDTIQFLRDLQVNNDKFWFEDNRARYTDVLLTPFQNLVKDLIPFMLELDPAFEVLPLRKCISRINRDIRFSKDKSPYRANMWLSFKRPTQDWKLDPTFFFELMPTGYRYGMGFSHMNKFVIRTLRETIDNHPEVVRIISNILDSKGFKVMGEEYKRPIGNYAQLSPELQQWYQRKELYVMCSRQIEPIIYSREILMKLMEDFMVLKPVYYFFWDLKQNEGINQSEEVNSE